MNKFKKIVAFIFIIEAFVIVLGNWMYADKTYKINDGDRFYRVEAERLIHKIESENMTKEEIENLDLSDYESITAIYEFDVNDSCNNDYMVEKIHNDVYRIEYSIRHENISALYMNIAFGFMIIISAVLFLYVYKKVIKPFDAMSELTYELAKGNLSRPVKEEKSRLFGRFLWGMDMLREKLENNKEKEFEFQKEKKQLILSLSHDIKTPLSAIELYSKALSQNLYKEEQKRQEAALGMKKNINEIKRYIDEIVLASREDFLSLEVVHKEFLLSDVINDVKKFYAEKLEMLHTEYIVDDYTDCMVEGDNDRLVEVIQNIMENAIKYGDGNYIRISFEDEEECRLVHIKNSGSPIKEDEIINIFDSFYRGSNSRDIKGNGLGLYICKSLMRKMQGDVYAKCFGDEFIVTVVIRKA